MYWAILAAAAIVLIFYIRDKIYRCTLKTVYLKTAVSVLFIFAGLFSWLIANPQDMMSSVMAVLVMLGLLAGLLGDVWLDLKYVFRKRDLQFTYAGFISFGIGHILYITGMLLKFGPSGKVQYVIVPVILAVVISIGNALLEKKMDLDYGSMKGIVIIYGALLFATLLISGSLALLHGWHEKTLIFIFIGGILFAVSDLVLSGTYFGKGKDRPADIIMNYVTYYPAQFLIASSLMFLS